MKIRRVTANNRKNQLELTVRSGKMFPIPYSKLEPRPTARDRVQDVYVDKEFGSEGVTYVLESGDEGAVHIDHALEYNQDPSYMSDLLVYQLTVEAKQRIEQSGLSRREIARRLKTSAAQLYRLLDPANTRKSINQLVELLHVLDCDVKLIVEHHDAA